jgi:predicted alpha/beta hydrolase
MADSHDFRLATADGESLHATLFAPDGTAEVPLVAVINPGAGIPASYYKRFAEGAADRGIVTITYDYRGIGASRPARLRGYRATIKDWGEFDAPAALRWVREQYPDRQRVVIGHSVGGFLAGFTPDSTLIDKMVFIGAHTGYWGDYARWARPLMWAMWHALMPAVTKTMGYFPARRLGLPEDLPAGVANDWAARTRPDFHRNFLRADGSLDAERFAEVRSRFAALDVDILTVTFSDDPFATPAATTRLRGLFTGCRFEESRIDVRKTNLRKIGHFGFFRSGAREKLWPFVIDWLVRAPEINPTARPDGELAMFVQHR